MVEKGISTDHPRRKNAPRFGSESERDGVAYVENGVSMHVKLAFETVEGGKVRSD